MNLMISTVVLLASWLSIWEAVQSNDDQLLDQWVGDHCAMFPDPRVKREQVHRIIQAAKHNKLINIESNVDRIKIKLAYTKRTSA